VAYKRKYRYFLVSSDDADTEKFEKYLNALKAYKRASSATLYGDKVDGPMTVIYSK